MLGKTEGGREGVTEDETAGRQHRPEGHELGQTLRDGEAQGPGALQSMGSKRTKHRRTLNEFCHCGISTSFSFRSPCSVLETGPPREGSRRMKCCLSFKAASFRSS